MALLSLTVVAAVLYTVAVACISSRTHFGPHSNKPFAPDYPDIDPPVRLVALRHIVALSSTILWLLRWPSVVEVWMALCLVPLLLVPYPLILNNMLEWVVYLIFGNSNGDGSHSNFTNGAPPIRCSWHVFYESAAAIASAVGRVYSWLSMMWYGREPTGSLNTNNALLCYLQKVSWKELHELPVDVLQKFPTPAPNSRVNALMMARCVTMSYDRWHNIDQAVSLRWNKQDPKISSPKSQKYSLVKAWSFDRVAVPSQLPPDAQSSPATDSGSGSKSCAPASAQHPDKIFDQYINDIISAISKTLVWLQQAVTAVIKHIKHASSKVLQRVVWFWAGAGDPGKVPVYDEDKFTSINTDAYLLKAVSEKPGGKVVALVLAFRGTEALQTVDWISDLAQINPPPDALDPKAYPLGFTHQGFRDSLGLKRNLRPADDLSNFSSSYLVYKPNTSHLVPSLQEVAASTGGGGFMAGPSNIYFTTPLWTPGTLTRVPALDKTLGVPVTQNQQQSPFAVITKDVSAAVASALEEFGPGTTVKVFVTGHSLGGALAHLYTGALLLREPKSAAARNFEAVYTFGEPRVGSQTWVTLVEEKLRRVPGGIPAEDRYKRIVNTLDIVTRVPPPLGELYQHPGHCTFIKPHFAIARPTLVPPPPGPGGVLSSALANPDLSAVVDDTAHPRTGTLPPSKATTRSGLIDDTVTEPDATKAGPSGTKAATSSEVDDSSYSPTTNLIETPEIFLGPAALTVVLKLVLSLLLLLSAGVHHLVNTIGLGNTVAAAVATCVVFLPVTIAVLAALVPVAAVAAVATSVIATVSVFAFVFFPSVYDIIISPVLKESQISLIMLVQSLAQNVKDRPKLINNPVYLLTRLLAFLGPAPIVLLADLLFLPAFTLFAPVLWWTVFVEPVLLGLLFVFAPPIVFSGLIDHSMAEYYTACWLTVDADWNTAAVPPAEGLDRVMSVDCIDG